MDKQKQTEKHLFHNVILPALSIILLQSKVLFLFQISFYSHV